MNLISKSPLAALALASIALSPALSAQMLGQTMDAEWIYPSFGSVLEGHTVVVSSGVELLSTTIVNDSKFEIDIDNDTILFNFNAASNWSSTAFNGWLFRDATGTLPQITGITIDSFSAGINPGTVVTGFNDDECWTNQSGMTVAGAGDWIRYKVTFATTGPTISVAGPCPGALVMTGSGFTPNGTVYFGYGAVVAPWNIILGPCAGTQISLVNPVLIVVLTADGSGNVSRSGTANAGCGIVNLLCFDAATCQESNFVAI